MKNRPSEESGHLSYYRSQAISPVRYEMRTLDEHFDRRDAIYRSVGLPQVAFKGCRVLEVAPGSGQNSLYVAQAAPARYDLVEPNPTGVADIKALYDQHAGSVMTPTLHPVTFESFEPDTDYDVVICENWLGSVPAELALIRKLCSLVAPGGALVMTIVPYSGFFPNVMRKLLAQRVNDVTRPFAEQTACLVEAFGPHLATIPDMTRTPEHWVQDCMLNPHYLNVALPLDIVFEQLDQDMEFLGCAPRFASDWRWFKGLVGDRRRFNDEFRRDYMENLHNFVDYRRTFPRRPAADNTGLDNICRSLHQHALAWQADCARTGRTDPVHSAGIARDLASLSEELGRVEPGWHAAVRELSELWSSEGIGISAIAEMEAFAALFGRETLYIALTRHRRS